MTYKTFRCEAVENGRVCGNTITVKNGDKEFLHAHYCKKHIKCRIWHNTHTQNINDKNFFLGHWVFNDVDFYEPIIIELLCGFCGSPFRIQFRGWAKGERLPVYPLNCPKHRARRFFLKKRNDLKQVYFKDVGDYGKFVYKKKQHVKGVLCQHAVTGNLIQVAHTINKDGLVEYTVLIHPYEHVYIKDGKNVEL